MSQNSMILSHQDYEDDEHTNVFVKFLPADIDDNGLRSLFVQCGTIISSKVMVNQSNGESLGYGFVRFASAEEAKKAVECMAGHRIGAKTLLCKLADTYSFPEPSCNLYIKPLPLGTSEATLRDMFAPYGHILTVKIVDVRVADSVVGFVKFSSVDSAKHAIEDMNGTKVFSNFPSLLVKYAESDVQRAVRKANNHPNQRTPHLSPDTEKQTISIQTSTIQITNSVSEFNDFPDYNPNKMEYDYSPLESENSMDIENNFYNNQLSPPSNQFYYFYVPVCVPLPCSSYMQPMSYPLGSPNYYFTK